jgi:hypothetical protein
MKRAEKRLTVGTDRSGRPLAYRPALRAQAKAVQAISLFAREGAAYRNDLAGLKHAPRSEPGMSHWWGPARLGSVLGVGSDAAAFNRLCTGRHPVKPETAVSYAAAAIKAGLLPRRAFGQTEQSTGHARALAPFNSLRGHLLRLKNFQVPGPELAAKIDRAASNYRRLLQERRQLEKDDRKCVREARQAVVRALLGLGPLVTGGDSSAHEELLGQLGSAISELSSTMCSLRASTWTLVETPRMQLVARAAQFSPASDADGEPDFPGLFAWLAERAVEPFPSRKKQIEEFFIRVLSRWGVDITAKTDFIRKQATAVEPMQLFDTAFTFDPDERCLDVADRLEKKDRGGTGIISRYVPAEAPFPSRLHRSVTRDQRRFLAKVGSSHRPYLTQFMTVMAMAERWYFGDEELDDPESDFVERLRRTGELALAAGAVGGVAAAAFKVSSDLARGWSPWEDRPGTKRLIKDLMRLDVRPVIEMDLDLPR